MDHIRLVFSILVTCTKYHFQSNLSNRDMMNRVQVGQKRAGTPLSNQIVKQRQAMPAQRNTRPAQAKDVKERFIFIIISPKIPYSWTLLATRCDLERPILTKNKSLKKFPVVTHKEIQVEIVPSELAKKNNDIEYYEIEFKGRKTPNKYNVKPNIKIVKLIGLQSDTRYLIKVFAVRNSSKYFIYPQI